MNESVYAPPKADLRKHSDADSNGDNAFYVVSLYKLTLLFFLTAGMYQLYWFYKNWSGIKDRGTYAGTGDADIWPIPRAIFSIFYVHSLFHKVDDYATEKERPLAWSADSLATPLMLVILVSNICDRLSYKGIGSPYTDILALLLLVPMYFGFRKAQGYINAACDDAAGISNSEFTGANWAWMIIGGIFWLLIIAGFVLPDVE
jgi:hypothetical protein